MSMMAKTFIVSCGVAVSVAAGGGVASAAPGDEAIVNSTCNYQQVVDALRVQSPQSADQITTNPVANGLLLQLINAGPPDRQRMIDQYRGVPQVQENLGLISQVARTCNKY